MKITLPTTSEIVIITLRAWGDGIMDVFLMCHNFAIRARVYNYNHLDGMILSTKGNVPGKGHNRNWILEYLY